MITVAATPLPTAARMRGSAPNTSLPTGISVPLTGAIGALSTTPAAKPLTTKRREMHPVRHPTRREEVEGAEGQPRHVEDGAEQVEDPERALVPTGRRTRGQRR